LGSLPGEHLSFLSLLEKPTSTAAQTWKHTDNLVSSIHRSKEQESPTRTGTKWIKDQTVKQ
jgi:hypothetical protein